jgi:hypothetical protein
VDPELKAFLKNVPGIEPRALGILGQRSAAELHPHSKEHFRVLIWGTKCKLLVLNLPR